jgi:hypothetical protein
MFADPAHEPKPQVLQKRPPASARQLSTLARAVAAVARNGRFT